MPRRKPKPTAAKLVEDYTADPELGIADLRARYGLSYQDVYLPLKEAHVLRGTARRRHRASPPG